MTAAPSRRTLVLVGLGVACWVAPGIAVPAALGGRTTADEPQYLMTAISVGEDANLDVADERADERYRAFHDADLPRQEVVRDDGSMVSPHDPLLPLVLAVPMRIGGWVAAKVVLAMLAGVLAATLAWTAVVRLRVPVRVAVITVLVFACSPPLAVYATQVYPEMLAALAVTLAIAALLGPLGTRGIVTVGAAVVALPWLGVKYAPVASTLAAVALVWVWRVRGRRASCVLAFGLTVAALTFAAAHLQWYGGLTPYAAGAHFTGGEFSAVGGDPNYAGRAVRLAGLTIDRDFGLAAWQPAFLLVIPAFAALLATRASVAVPLAVSLAAGWLNATFVALTMHGWWFPGRQVVVVVPCAVLAVAWWAATRPITVRALAALGVFGASVFAWFVLQGVVGDLTLVVGFESVTHPVARAWRLFLPDDREAGTLDWAMYGAWLVAMSALALRTVTSRPSIEGAIAR